jgi:hypothetical protein
MASKKSTRKYTESELMTLLKFIVGLSLAATLVGIVFAVLYSIIFVTQPLDAISPIDTKFFELIIPIATFLSGTLSGIMLGGSPEKPKAAEPEELVEEGFIEEEPKL